MIVLGSLRPHSIIKDDSIPALLQELKQPTFITINYSDFWRKIAAHQFTPRAGARDSGKFADDPDPAGVER